MDFKYAIFDMDGTLIDSTRYWHEVQQEFLRKKGLTEAEIAAIVLTTQPMTTLESSEYYIRELGFSGTAEDIANETDGMMAEHYRHDVPLKPGAVDFLEALQAKGVKMCIASATVKSSVLIAMERLELHKYFEFVLSCAEVGSGKEKPDVFLEAARRLGARPEECAVYEDSVIAVTTAKAAGFHTVGIYDHEAAENWPKMQEIAHELITDWTLCGEVQP